MAIKSYQLNGKKFYEVYVNGFDLHGRRIQMRKRGFESIRKAQDAEFDFENKILKLRKEGRTPLWREWMDIALKRMKKDSAISTVINYEASLNKWVTPQWGDKDLQKITKDDVYQIVFETFDQSLSPHSRKTILKQIRRIFEMAVEDGILDRNPATGIKVQVPETEQKVLTNEEVKTFLRMAKDTNHRFYPIWAMALMTGMRSGELFALNWSDICFETKQISISKQWTNKCGIGPTKSRRSRIVPISDELSVFLKKLKLQSTEDSVLPRLKEWENGEQALVTREFCACIGITSVKFHDLRATFITNLLARGVALAVVMSIVGHSQLKTTNGYLRKAGVEIQGGTDKLGYGIPEDRQSILLKLVQ